MRATIELNCRLPYLRTMNAAVIHYDFAIDEDHRRIVRHGFEGVPIATKREEKTFVSIRDTGSVFAQVELGGCELRLDLPTEGFEEEQVIIVVTCVLAPEQASVVRDTLRQAAVERRRATPFTGLSREDRSRGTVQMNAMVRQ